MSVEQFFDQQYGQISSETEQPKSRVEEQEELDEEKEETEESLRKARAFDDFKDCKFYL